MNLALSGAILGTLAAAGVAAAVLSSPPLRRPTLADRMAPYVRESVPMSRLLRDKSSSVSPFPTIERLIRPLLRDVVRRLDRVMGGVGNTRNRLEAAGLETTLEQFRMEQLLWGAGGFGAGLVAALLLLARGHRSPVPLLLLVFAATLGGVVGRDRFLTRQVREREQRMVEEFPAVAEMLALAVAAGEGPLAALERVARTVNGELARELRRALTETRAGSTLVQALDGVARRTSLPVLARFVDGVSVAVERGTPLADVLRAQAVDVREVGKRALLDAAGKKEIAMMVPIVFLILPITILFLLYPGLVNLSITAP